MVSSPEFTAVILAATTGARLFPMTSVDTPKHTLPVAGVPVVLRLLQFVAASGFLQCVVTLANSDSATLTLLKEELGEPISHHVFLFKEKMQVTIHILPEECAGSGEALSQIHDLIAPSSHLVVLPGDLVVFETSVLAQLVDAHRQSNLTSSVSTACTMLLADVGEQDEHGVPLKESSKQKKGGLAREEEDIEYIALASTPSLPPRVVWKQSKIDTEEDEDMVGQSPKLILPKPRLRGGAYVRVTTDWTDLHVYVLSPWLLTCMRERHLLSLQSDGIPLWVSRQFQGVSKTFGNGVKDGVVEQILSSFRKGNSYATPNVSTEEYAVRAHVLDGWKALRACTIPSYLFACREVVTRAVEDVDGTSNLCVVFPPNTTINARSQTIVLEDATLGEKVTIKSSTIGRSSKISAKCRLNNVVLMDNVVVKENCVLQNSILGKGCTIGENCNLNDCQVAPGKVVPAGTKEKGESLMDATLV